MIFYRLSDATFYYRINTKYQFINKSKKKKILFVNTGHTTDQKMGVPVLLRLFISGKPFSDKTKCLFLRNMDPSR